MTFRESLESVFAKAFVFSGRASRPEFWWFALFWALTYATIALVGALSLPEWLARALQLTFLFVTAPPLIAVSFRRLQDTGRTGWLSQAWVFGAVVESGGALAAWDEAVFTGRAAQIGILLVLLAWYASRGTRGPNAYGPPALGGAA